MTVPGSFGRMHVVPAPAGFCAQHPSVRLDLRLSDEALDVVEGADDLVASNGAIRPLD